MKSRRKSTEPPVRVGTQGWEQFLTYRKQMLAAFDRERDKSRAHRVQTSHGDVGEMEVRRWLNEFLPKKWAAADGYIVSQGAKDDTVVPHFDVIIYDQLESPVLWFEGSHNSPGDRTRAIPVEFVRAVIEVKSSFEPSTVTGAMKKLESLEPLLREFDAPDERYKKFLPKTFISEVIFFELRRQHEFSKTTINRLVPQKLLRGYVGGLVLRGEGIAPNDAGRIALMLSDQPLVSAVGRKKESLLGGFLFSDTQPLNGKYVGATLMWSQVAFAEFSFDLVARLNGVYDKTRLASLYGLNWFNPARDRAARPPKAG